MTQIKRIRESLAMLRLELSTNAGISVRTLRDLETRKSKTKKVQERVRRDLAAVLGVDQSILFTKKGSVR